MNVLPTRAEARDRLLQRAAEARAALGHLPEHDARYRRCLLGGPAGEPGGLLHGAERATGLHARCVDAYSRACTGTTGGG